MKTLIQLEQMVDEVLATDWKRRPGRKVPESDDVGLGNDAVELEATVLYADLAESTKLVKGFKDWFAAEVYKAYLATSCAVIKNNNGIITAFDGDRVMAVYIGDSRNTSAAKSALQINYLATRVINPKLQSRYPTTAYVLRQAVGLDSSKLFVAKTGIRGSNDLVWVGRAANYAAKLSSMREQSYSTFITSTVFESLDDDARFGGDPRRSMWIKFNWDEFDVPAYKSSWYWKPA